MSLWLEKEIRLSDMSRGSPSLVQLMFGVGHPATSQSSTRGSPCTRFLDLSKCNTDGTADQGKQHVGYSEGIG